MRHSLYAVAMTGLCLGFAPAQAAVSTLTFAGDICGPAGTAACADYAQIGQSYGDGEGIDVSYRSISMATGMTYEPFLKVWNVNYGDLNRIVWGGNNRTGYVSEIVFTPLDGYEVALIGFDLATYLGRSASAPFAITSGATSIFAGTVETDYPGHGSVAVDSAYYTDAIVLRWGPDGYDVGLDNIAFDIRAVTSAPAVPEPAGWAMMIAGFGLIGGSLRRHASSTPRAA